jgi:uncharacterized protein with PQ loop repeat
MMHIYEFFGYAAGAIGVYLAIPQARNIRRLGHGEGVSLSYWLIMLVMMSSWLSYGILIDSPSIILSNLLGFFTTAMVVSALLKRGWLFWPMVVVAGAAWVLIFKLIPLEIITVVLVVGTFSRIPQIIRSVQNLRRRVASAVSMRSQFMSLTAMLLWEGYSFLSGKESLVITTTSGLTMVSIVIVLELAGRARANRIQAIELVDGPQA